MILGMYDIIGTCFGKTDLGLESGPWSLRRRNNWCQDLFMYICVYVCIDHI